MDALVSLYQRLYTRHVVSCHFYLYFHKLREELRRHFIGTDVQTTNFFAVILHAERETEDSRVGCRHEDGL